MLRSAPDSNKVSFEKAKRMVSEQLSWRRGRRLALGAVTETGRMLG